MLSRAYNIKIDIYVKTFTNDGYGGQIASNSLVKSIWAKVVTNAGNKFVNFGIQDFKNPVVFSVRAIKNDIDYTENHFVKYQGLDFFIKGLENKSYEGMELNLYCDES